MQPLTITPLSFSVPENQSVPISSYFTLSDPSNVTQYLFDDLGGGDGYFTVGGTAQPDNSLISVAASDLNTVQYVGGSSPGIDTLQIGGFDRTTNSYDLSSTFTATTAPSAQDYINAANAVYFHAVPTDATQVLSSEADLRGFNAAAFEENGVIVIAYEGTLPGSNAYGIGSLLADVQIFAGKTPAALTDAVDFAQQVQSDFGSTPIYITGHSLGGAEAEAAVQAAVSNNDPWILGGVTFGAPGLPGYYGPADLGNLTDYVDYGDPIGNYAHDTELAGLADFVAEVGCSCLRTVIHRR